MNALKERILEAVTVMNEADTLRLWEIIADEFGDVESDWDSISEVVPDDMDLQMLSEIENDPECREFVPASEAEKFIRF